MAFGPDLLRKRRPRQESARDREMEALVVERDLYRSLSILRQNKILELEAALRQRRRRGW
jgi:hypothetical protein